VHGASSHFGHLYQQSGVPKTGVTVAALSTSGQRLCLGRHECFVPFKKNLWETGQSFSFEKRRRRGAECVPLRQHEKHFKVEMKPAANQFLALVISSIIFSEKLGRKKNPPSPPGGT
jgi:hypothetical protein